MVDDDGMSTTAVAVLSNYRVVVVDVERPLCNLSARVVSVDEIVYHLMVSSLLSLNRDFCQDVRLDPGTTVRVGRRPPPPGHVHAYNVTIESPYVARFQFELSSTASALNEVWRLTSRSWGGTLISPRFSSMRKVNQNESADISPGDTIYISTSPQIGFVLYSPKAAAVTKPPRAAEGEEELPDEHCCIICLDTMKDPSTVKGCHHSFCGECLDAWLERSDRCPVCACPVTQL
ncbi:hypothetical protein FOZ62_029902 [Perkinsus olseni]|uniref:RING-type domain-containing protein n=2 Tax=Perkinsus olseni TaxID=32597 RepID=A0A7J6SGY9_PEROL|nr:hypothetical protein FOZ62_029902 [Perkinsus olseni]